VCIQNIAASSELLKNLLGMWTRDGPSGLGSNLLFILQNSLHITIGDFEDIATFWVIAIEVPRGKFAESGRAV
jgi:hypothetical protein